MAMMHSNRQYLFFTFYFFIILLQTQLVSGIWIPLRDSGTLAHTTDQHEIDEAVEIKGLELLEKYVCPTSTNFVKRQDSNSISVPIALVQDFIHELQLLEQQFQLLLGQSASATASSSSENLPQPTFNSIPESKWIQNEDGEPEAQEISTIRIISTITLNETISLTATLPYTTLPVAASSIPAPSFETPRPPSNDDTDNENNDEQAATTNPIPQSTPTSTASTSSSSTPPTTGDLGISGSPHSYTFNAQSTQKIAVYYGQSSATGSSSLASQCSNPSIDIVILAFVVAQKADDSKYPQIKFGAACEGRQTPAMIAQAPGLLSCPALAADVQECQGNYGKKVFLSVGGSTSRISFGSEEEARDLAGVLWKLFGPAGSVEDGLRPVGNAVVDCFDIDNEDNLPAHWTALASTLRTLYATDTSKTYYLSSAPQCIYPDASNPTSLLLFCDFIFVQFYNNPSCGIGSSNFESSIKQWSDALQGLGQGINPMLYLGLPAFGEAGRKYEEVIGSARG